MPSIMPLADMPKAFNDRRAAHRVMALAPELGTNVKIPYRGYVISLSSSGCGIHVESFEHDYEHDMSQDGGYTTSGEDVLRAMHHIDGLIGTPVDLD